MILWARACEKSWKCALSPGIFDQIFNEFWTLSGDSEIDYRMAIVFYLMTFKSFFKGKWVLQIIPRSMLLLHEMIFEGNLYSKFCVNLKPFFNEKWLQIYANFGI